VDRRDYASPSQAGCSYAQFWKGLPGQLKAQDLKALVGMWTDSIRSGYPIIAMCGAHVLKVGLGPLLIQAMREKWITALALNGAGAVHDFELAYQGATSEDVAAGLENGTFGMVEETGRFVNAAAVRAHKKSLGFGEALAREIEGSGARYPEESVIVQEIGRAHV